MSLSDEELQANRLELISRLAGDISHEIKNPLHAMVINLELVRRKVERGERDQALERVTLVEGEIRKVHALANALLEALRPPRERSATCSFFAIVEEMLPLVTARARLARTELVVHTEGDTLMVPLASQDLRLVLLGIADRVVRAATREGTGGSIALRARADAHGASLEFALETDPFGDAERDWLRDPSTTPAGIDRELVAVRGLLDAVGGRIDADLSPDEAGLHRLEIHVPAAGAA